MLFFYTIDEMRFFLLLNVFVEACGAASEK